MTTHGSAPVQPRGCGVAKARRGMARRGKARHGKARHGRRCIATSIFLNRR